MKIHIVGDGAFGSFLKELLAPHCELTDAADVVILAVPAQAYDECGRIYGRDRKAHLVNVCSVQQPTTMALLKYTNRITGLHPLFGRRTPADRRGSILTLSPDQLETDNDTWSMGDSAHAEFLAAWGKVSTVYTEHAGKRFTTATHDILMAKTHGQAVLSAKQLKVVADRVADVPDCLVPNSFRLLRDFVRSMEDMPAGTLASILENPYL